MHPSFAPTHRRISPARSGLRLARHVGVGDDGARHPDQVGGAVGQGVLGLFRVHDPAGVEHRHAERAFVGGGQGQIDPMREIARRDVSGPALQRLDGPPVTENTSISLSASRRRATSSRSSGESSPGESRRRSRARTAAALPDRFADRTQHVDGEREAALERPAVASVRRLAAGDKNASGSMSPNIAISTPSNPARHVRSAAAA